VTLSAANHIVLAMLLTVTAVWLVVLVLELVVFTALKIRDQRRTRRPAPDSTGPEL
jgi:heme/copper-type cytochrome/quinol oxidase subunit 2